MLFHIRVVGRRIDGKVQSDFHAVVSDGLLKMVKFCQCAEGRFDGIMPSLAPADGPETARFARLGLQAVVASLAIGLSDRMNRREVENIETHIPNGR